MLFRRYSFSFETRTLLAPFSLFQLAATAVRRKDVDLGENNYVFERRLCFVWFKDSIIKLHEFAPFW